MSLVNLNPELEFTIQFPIFLLNLHAETHEAEGTSSAP